MAKTHTLLKNIMDKVRIHETAWPFQEAVDREQVRQGHRSCMMLMQFCLNRIIQFRNQISHRIDYWLGVVF
jgi:hypothetical protein